MSITLAFDATHLFIGQLPRGSQACGYDTGSNGVAWTAADWAAHPGAVHIDQDVHASDFTADVLDCEKGAVPVGSGLIPLWAESAQHNFRLAVRPGQRMPAIYCSASNVTANVNALVRGGIKGGVGLWVASWGIGQNAAVADVLAGTGPFPVIGVQFSDLGDIDADVFSDAWLANTSRVPVPAPAWTYGPVRGLQVASVGPSSVKVSFSAPSVTVPAGVVNPVGIGRYEIAVTLEGSPVDLSTYPRFRVKRPNPQAEQVGSLPPGTELTAWVRAWSTDPGDSHAGPWATVNFETKTA
ncbi:MAG TPA: hypothetical protein VGG75_13955 [Trebonia sp.]|jgi:hypothetical protein